MNDATLALLEAVLTLVIGIGGAILIPKLREISNQKIGVANTNMILTWADTAVKMAEQKLGSGAGNAKFDLAMAVLQGASNWNNFKVDEKTLEAAI
jgi:hypothetical protein